MFSYPVTVYPTNQVIQSTFFINYDEGSYSRNLLNSIASTIVLALGLLFAIQYYSKLDTLLATTALLIGAPVVLIIPSLCHYKLIAARKDTGNDRCIDLSIIIYAVIMIVSILSI